MNIEETISQRLKVRGINVTDQRHIHELIDPKDEDELFRRFKDVNSRIKEKEYIEALPRNSAHRDGKGMLLKKCKDPFETAMEWYTGRLFTERLGASGFIFGVETDLELPPDMTSIGDIDCVILHKDHSLVLLESKSGAVSQEHVDRCMKRSTLLLTAPIIVAHTKSITEMYTHMSGRQRRIQKRKGSPYIYVSGGASGTTSSILMGIFPGRWIW